MPAPDGPDDARELVRDGDGGLVVDVCGLELVRPFAEPIGLGFSGMEQDRARAVNEERAQVAVASLRDAAEASLEAARELSRGEPEVAGEVSARGKAPDVAQERDESGGGEQADAGDGQQQRDRGQLLRGRLELAFDELDAAFDVANLVARFRHHIAQPVGDLGVGVFDLRPHRWHDVARADRNEEAQLA